MNNTETEREECWIPLTRGKTALIDEEDYELVSKFKWHLSSYGYAKHDIQNKRLKTHYLMHRLIMSCPGDFSEIHVRQTQPEGVCKLTEALERIRDSIGYEASEGYPISKTEIFNIAEQALTKLPEGEI